MRAHAVVVGGGIMGTSIALHLAQRCDPLREPVVLCERRALGAGSSGRSGAILRQFYSDLEVAGMARDSLRVWSGFEGRNGRSVGFRRCGVLTLAGPDRPADVALVRRNVERLSAIGVGIELLEGAQIARVAPRLPGGLGAQAGTVAAWEPEAGTVDPQRAVDAFAALARFHGASTRLACEVHAVRVVNGRVRGVETSDGAIESERVIVAAGPWARPLLARAGVDLPLTVVRPEQHFVSTPAPLGTAEEAPDADVEVGLADSALRAFSVDEALHPALHPVLLDLQHGFYARCEPNAGRTRVGEMDYQRCEVLADPDALREEVSAGFSRWARQALASRAPAYAREPDAGTLAAWYTLTPDSQAVLGAWPELPGLWIAAGFSGHGFKLAPAVGEGMARLVMGEAAGTFDPAFFDPQRFAAGRARAGDEETSSGGAFGL